MAIRDNAQDLIERAKKNLPAIVAAAVAYVLALPIVCSWVADIADKDQSLISSKDVIREDIEAMANMGYWTGKAWFWSLLAAAVLVGFLIKAAGEKKVSVGKAAFLTASSVVIVVCAQGWIVVSKAALLKSLLGNWPKLILIIVMIWLIKKFWPKIKKFFAPRE